MLQRGTPKMCPKLGKDHQPVKDRHGNPVYETVKDKNGKVVYEPYRIKVLNTINFKKSMHYNPFAYLHSEKDILKLVTTLMLQCQQPGEARQPGVLFSYSRLSYNGREIGLTRL